MTPDKLKLLFALAHPGKCWHERNPNDSARCLKCKQVGDINNPTFTTFAEIEGVMQGLMREGLWEKFEDFAYGKHMRCRPLTTFVQGFFSKDESGKLRFFDLVAECPSVVEWWNAQNSDCTYRS